MTGAGDPVETEGIDLSYNSTSNLLLNNSISNFYGDGISIYGSSGNILIGNNVSGNTAEFWDEGAIHISLADQCNVTENIVDDNSETGILIEASNYCIASNNSILRNKFYTEGDGMELSDSNYCSISNNNVSGNDYFGIELENSNFNTVTQNFFESNGQGCVSVVFYDANLAGTNLFYFGYWRGIWNWNLVYNNFGCWIVIVPGEPIWILAGIIFAIIGIIFIRKHRRENSKVQSYLLAHKDILEGQNQPETFEGSCDIESSGESVENSNAVTERSKKKLDKSKESGSTKENTSKKDKPK
jgi:parallel beta-helix repeat protein